MAFAVESCHTARDEKHPAQGVFYCCLHKSAEVVGKIQPVVELCGVGAWRWGKGDDDNIVIFLYFLIKRIGKTAKSLQFYH